MEKNLSVREFDVEQQVLPVHSSISGSSLLPVDREVTEILPLLVQLTHVDLTVPAVTSQHKFDVHRLQPVRQKEDQFRFYSDVPFHECVRLEFILMLHWVNNIFKSSIF